MKLKILGQNIHFDLGEIQIMKRLMENDICTEAQAINEVIGYKREQAVYYEELGNFALAEHLWKAIDEWDDTRAEAYKAATEIIEDNNQKIIVPKDIY